MVEIKRKKAAWEARRVCNAFVVELLEAALMDQDKADQGDQGDGLEEQAIPGHDGALEGCTLTPVVDPANVDQSGWKSSQVVQGSGVRGGGGVMAQNPTSEVERTKMNVTNDDDKKNAENVKPETPASIKLEMMDSTHHNLKSSPCVTITRPAHSDEVVYYNVGNGPVVKHNVVNGPAEQELIQRVEAVSFEKQNMIDVSPIEVKSSPCAEHTRTAHSVDIVITEIARQTEHLQRLEPVSTVQSVHSTSNVQSDRCTLATKDAHARGVHADRGTGYITSEVFTSVQDLVEEWERKEEEGGKVSLQPQSSSRRKSSEFLSKLSIYEERSGEHPKAETCLLLHTDRVNLPRLRKTESDLCAVSIENRDNLLLANNPTNQGTEVRGACGTKEILATGTDNFTIKC